MLQLVRRGVVRVERPDRLLRALRELYRFGATPVGAYCAAARRYPDGVAIVDEAGELTFEQVHRRTNALARAFAAEGIGHRDAVALLCRDHRWFIEASVALWKLGATILYCNTAFAAPQLEQVVDREQPVGLIYDEEFRELIEQAGGDRKRWVAWRDDAGGADPSLAELIDRGDDSDLAAPPGAGRSVLLTSGSTGTPKGAARGRPQVLSSISALLSRIPLAAREPTVMAAPLFHAWGFLHLQFGMLLASTLVLRRRFDPEGTLAAIDRNKATALAIVPVMMQRILELDADTIGRYDTSSLRVVAASGGALPAELGRRWMDKFGDNLYNLYGSTEVAWAAIATPADLRAAPGTSGSAPPGTSLKILDDEHRDLPSGETGQIYVRSEMLFEGYTGGGSEDLVDGHLATGDLGYLDEAGRLFVEGRADEMIVSGGENVYPQEVEQTLQEHDAVREAAVIGVDDEEFGQRLKAFVVADRDVSADELKSHVKSHLAGFKVPRDITRVEELPRKPQGKVDKQKLAEGDRHGAGED